MTSKREQIHQAATELTRKLVDEGKLIEAGFVLFAAHVIPDNAPEVQHREMRLAFMAGAQHVFGSVMTMLDAGEEPTDADLRRMDQIHKELEAFTGELSQRIDPAKGHA